MAFEWDRNKNEANADKHGISFDEAQYAFFDHNRLILKDEKHSVEEERFFCIGVVNSKICTVRFTHRENAIRIFGASYWREGRMLYEKRNNI